MTGLDPTDLHVAIFSSPPKGPVKLPAASIATTVPATSERSVAALRGSHRSSLAIRPSSAANSREMAQLPGRKKRDSRFYCH